MGGWRKKKSREGFQREPLREVPTMREAVGLLGGVMVLFLLVTYFMFKTPAWSLPAGINSRFIAVLVIELLGVGLPVAIFLRVRRFDPGRVLGLTKSTAASLAGAALMGAATVVVAPQFETWQARLIPPPEQYLEALAEFISLEQGESVLLALLCLAVVPALCEEALFRGILLKACLARWSKTHTIVGIGIIFGLFHLDMWRWPLLSVIGMLITWTAVKTASIWPAITFHLVNNGTSVMLANCDWPAEREWTEGVGDVPPGLFVLGVGLLVAGAGLIRRNKKHDSTNNEK